LRGGEFFAIEDGKPDFRTPVFPEQNSVVISPTGAYQYRDRQLVPVTTGPVPQTLRGSRTTEGGALAQKKW